MFSKRTFFDTYTVIHVDISYFTEILSKVMLYVKMQKKTQGFP